MHELQQSTRSNRAEGSPWHFSLKCLAVQAFHHHSLAILSHHGPPEPLLNESQGLLLALMSCIPMYTVKRHVALGHGDNKGWHFPLSYLSGSCLCTLDPYSEQDCCEHGRTSCLVPSQLLLPGTP